MKATKLIATDNNNPLRELITSLESEGQDGLVRPRCVMPWQSLMIDVTGNVQPCAYRGNYTNLSDRPSLGNINNQTLEEIWNGEEARHLRRCMAAGDLEGAGCSKCLAVAQGQKLGFEYDSSALDAAPVPYVDNLIEKLEEVLSGAQTCASRPTVLYYTPDHRCNLSCLHCYQNISRRDSIQRQSAGDELLGLVPFLSDVVAGGGEPLILPFWRRFLSSGAKKDNPFLRFSTTTNATVLRDEVYQNISEFQRMAIIISIDGATKETFEKIRFPAKWPEFIANAKRLRALCANNNNFFSFNISTMKDNLLELPDLVNLCANFEAPYNYQPVVSYPAAQSLRCFNNPPVQMAGWLSALSEAECLLEREFFPVMEKASESNRVSWSDEYRQIYKGHISALRGLIPWHLLEYEYFEYKLELPAIMSDRIHYIESSVKTYRKSGEGLVLLFFQDEAPANSEPFYYAALEDNLLFSVHLPDGRYRLKAVQNDFPLGSRSEVWDDVLLVVSQGKARFSVSALRAAWQTLLYQARKIKRRLSKRKISQNK